MYVEQDVKALEVGFRIRLVVRVPQKKFFSNLGKRGRYDFFQDNF